MSNDRKASDYIAFGFSLGEATRLMERAIKDAKDGQDVLVVLNVGSAERVLKALESAADRYIHEVDT